MGIYQVFSFTDARENTFTSSACHNVGTLDERWDVVAWGRLEEQRRVFHWAELFHHIRLVLGHLHTFSELNINKTTSVRGQSGCWLTRLSPQAADFVTHSRGQEHYLFWLRYFCDFRKAAMFVQTAFIRFHHRLMKAVILINGFKRERRLRPDGKLDAGRWWRSVTVNISFSDFVKLRFMNSNLSFLSVLLTANNTFLDAVYLAATISRSVNCKMNRQLFW